MESSSTSRYTTVADVAQLAQVSKAQAARALGGYGAVSDEVRSRVLAAAETLQYHPNELARSMNTGRSKTIGVVVGDIENPYFSLAMRGIYDTCKAGGFDVILINTGEDLSTEIDAVNVLLDKRVDGMIVAPVTRSPSTHLKRVVDSGRPVVLLDRKVPSLPVDTVVAEMQQVSYQAARHLLDEGHTRVGYISSLDVGGADFTVDLDLGSNPVAERIAGMRRAFDEGGVALPVDLIRLGAGKQHSIADLVDALLAGPDPATAIVASDSVIALEALAELQRAGIRIPDDVSFLMFDELPWAGLMTPPITVVAQPVYDQGVAAAEILLRRIGGDRSEPEHLALPSRLIVRGSVAAIGSPVDPVTTGASA
ncbi:LacI family transcriptional regulator [Arthrobacter sp. NamB2]|uniref:LacI family DNA-binding transcriptional regulator n=1 Tax=Arthrobacter sp. NamB2 TaxID=2576035 RepID=UPI0010C98980|nr:LacI family DNA-binding transcriptional regulator [Arthrobacter sp. NamB2]TKV28505.1 LacI family transcriptional regulator [Arthrobacter sp. NamB2]